MPATIMHPEPFGVVAVSGDLNAARKFYSTLYPYPVTEGEFAGIRYLSIMKDGVVLVNVFERSDRNPVTGMIPMLKVESVSESCREVEQFGGRTVIPTAVCPCTHTNFAICQDAEGNQFMVKEAACP